MEFFLCVLGMVLIIEALPYIVSPSKMKAMMKKVEELPDRTLQITGFIAALCGLAIIYFGRAIGGQ